MSKVTTFPLLSPEALKEKDAGRASAPITKDTTVIEMDEYCNIVCVRKFDPAVDKITPITLKPVTPIRRNHWPA